MSYTETEDRGIRAEAPAKGSIGHRGLSAAEMRGRDYAFLRSTAAPKLTGQTSTLNMVDLFCGAGGISLGIVEAANSLGIAPRVKWAVDFDVAALAVYKANFPLADAEHADLGSVFSIDIQAPLTSKERALRRKLGDVQLLVGGPPCQGHSDLNNFSRRDDPKNKLYLVMARAAKVLRPQAVLIENVPGARHDRSNSVEETLRALSELGYSVKSSIVDMRHIGVPQTRKRFILIATRDTFHEFDDVLREARTPERNVAWAIEDLVGMSPAGMMDTPATSAPATKRRIDYLFENNLYQLPNEQRPPCHSSGGHSYKSIYGRLRWEDCAQTITSGFFSMCMGRYVHPSERRTLTAREAARLQFFPDYFTFDAAKSRTAIAQIIGNAVPPKFSFVFGRAIIPKLLGA